jgi:hypothetical protein
MPTYRIAWRNSINGQVGHGEYMFSKNDYSDLQRVVSNLNMEFMGAIFHWIESQPAVSALNGTHQQVRAGTEERGTGTVGTENNSETCQATRQ